MSPTAKCTPWPQLAPCISCRVRRFLGVVQGSMDLLLTRVLVDNASFGMLLSGQVFELGDAGIDARWDSSRLPLIDAQAC